tara:strand:+ start:359 stop:664 length:306 start_codon:yes stop_codon:yes gene_type:complete
MQDKTKGNPTNFKVGESLGPLFAKAKEHNRLNKLLKEAFPEQFKGLNLCLVDGFKAVLIAKNSSVAFRAEKQQGALLSIINEIEALTNIKTIAIKVDKKNY